MGRESGLVFISLFQVNPIKELTPEILPIRVCNLQAWKEVQKISDVFCVFSG